MATTIPTAPYLQNPGGEFMAMTTSTVVKAGDSYLQGIWCSTAGTLGVYNGTASGASVVAPSFAVAAATWYAMPVHCPAGIFINFIGGTPHVTVSFY